MINIICKNPITKISKRPSKNLPWNDVFLVYLAIKPSVKSKTNDNRKKIITKFISKDKKKEKNNPINPISKLHMEIKFGLIFKNMGEIKIANNL